LAAASADCPCRARRWLRIGALAASLILLAGCDLSALGVSRDREDGPRRDDPYQKALQYKQDSECDRAIPLLEPLADRGHGFEVAQYQLGTCYLERARNDSSPERAANLRKNAAEWLLKAANSGDPGAQEQAIRLYADGTGVGADAVEAAKWFIILESNPLRRLYGPLILDADLEQALRQKLGDSGWAEARARAKEWRPVEQPLTLPQGPEPPRRRR